MKNYRIDFVQHGVEDYEIIEGNNEEEAKSNLIELLRNVIDEETAIVVITNKDIECEIIECKEIDYKKYLEELRCR